MMMNKSNITNKKYALLPYELIAEASTGDAVAINKVLKHYEGYIVYLSSKFSTDIHGRTSAIVDNELRQILETQLVTKIVSFSA